jgi:hypothetical protein
MSFVFLSMDQGDIKRLIARTLQDAGVPFVDVGLGVLEANGELGGLLRVTTSTDAMRDHVWEKGRIPFSDGTSANDYARNIQVADLNSLCATLAVIKFKKHFGFYRDLEREHHTLYTIDGNTLCNSDCPIVEEAVSDTSS